MRVSMCEHVSPQTVTLRKILTKSDLFLSVCGCNEFEACIYLRGMRHEDTLYTIQVISEKVQRADHVSPQTVNLRKTLTSS